MNLLRLICFLCLLSLNLQGELSSLDLKSAQLSFEKALSLEDEDQTRELNKAKLIYQKALSSSSDHAYLHYNLGTVLLKLKDYGSSIYHLEQAYALNNNDERIVGNLQRARLLAGLQGKEQDDKELSQVFSTTWSELNPKVLQGLAVFLGVLLSIAMFIKGLGKGAINLWLSLLVCSATLYLAHAHANGQWMKKKAILLNEENPRSGIGNSYPGLLKDDVLKPGSAGTLMRQEQGWVEIHWEQGLRGWTKSDKVGIIQ